MDPIERLTRLRTQPERLLLGLMSGMSLDGLDLALVRVRGSAPSLHVTLVAGETVPYEAALVDRLRSATSGSAAEAARLSLDLAERWASDALAFLARHGVEPSEVDALGSHGQTLFHASRSAGGGRAVTLQVGDGDVLAERTGILTVSDFRPRDIAAGGEGAPLIPWVDWCLWAQAGATTAALNLGSIANLTVITPEPERVLAFDAGPANALIDGLARAMPGDHGGIDRDGCLSAAGRVDGALLAWLERERAPYLDRTPPKSAGFADFGPPLATQALERFASVAGADRVRTAVEFTALALERAWRAHVAPRFPDLALLRASGGGTRNPTLLRVLRARLTPLGVSLEPLDDALSNVKEALGFALLADATVRGLTCSLPSATGARGARALGKLSLPA